jgi:hypothetical protein
MLQLAGQRCFSLDRLSLAGCRLPKEQLADTLPRLASLSSLSLARSSLSDSLLSVVGLYCPRLRSLDLSYCDHISDSGLLTLFLQQDVEGNTITDRFGACVGLTKLLVSGSLGITDTGATEALLHLPDLAVFDYHNCGAVITRLLVFHNVDRLPLRTLHCSPEEEQDLPAVVVACPALETLHLSTRPGLSTESSLLGLLDCAGIRELKVCNEAGLFSLPVLSHLGPVLRAHGRTLVSLSLAEVAEVPVDLLATACPALLHLALLWNLSYLAGPAPPALPFPRLLTAEVAAREPGDPPATLLAALLAAPRLHTLKLAQCAALTDRLVAECAEQSAMLSLRRLELSCCPGLSLAGLHPLLLRPNSLEAAAFLGCGQVTLADFQDYQRKVKKWKWKIDLKWS